LKTPIASGHLSWLVIWIIAPYAVRREKGDGDKAREVVKNYLTNVHRIKPLYPNPGFWLRIVNQTRELAVAEQKQKNHIIMPMSLAALRRHNPLLYRELVSALAVSDVDRLSSKISTGED
jgi:hypothetical protein